MKTTKYTYPQTIIQTQGYTQNKHNRGQLPQRARLLGLNGGGAAAAVPPSGDPGPVVVLLTELSYHVLL